MDVYDIILAHKIYEQTFTTLSYHLVIIESDQLYQLPTLPSVVNYKLIHKILPTLKLYDGKFLINKDVSHIISYNF